MDEILNVVNDTQGATVEPQIDSNIVTDNPIEGGSEPIISQSNEKPAQDKDTNNAFAEMRKARESAESRAAIIERDFNYYKKYSELGVSSETELKQAYGHQGINTWEDVDRYYEAQSKNIDPEVYQRVIKSEETAKQALDKLSQYERKEAMIIESEAMTKDPKWGSFFTSNKDAILSMAEKFNVDLKTARLLVLDEKFEQPDTESIKQAAIKEHIEKVKTGNVPIETSGGGGTFVSTSPKSWEDARKGAMALFKANKQA